jgi:hypothetical protein
VAGNEYTHYSLTWTHPLGDNIPSDGNVSPVPTEQATPAQPLDPVPTAATATASDEDDAPLALLDQLLGAE